MRYLADLAYLLAGVFYLPILIYQAVFQRKNRHGWGDRLGFVPHRAPGRQRVWVHAVSLGEMNATPKLVQALGELLPGVEFVFSTTTDTGFARAVQLYGADRVFRFPLDFSVVVRRVLDRVNPSMIVLVELEVWHNLVRTAASHGIPVAIVNGRLTEKSCRRLRRLGRAVRGMFGDLSWVGAQDEATATRFRSLGVSPERVEVISSLKWDTAAVLDRVDGSDRLAASLGIGAHEPMWVCGSTGPGEEDLILDAYRCVLNSAAHENLPEKGSSTKTGQCLKTPTRHSKRSESRRAGTELRDRPDLEMLRCAQHDGEAEAGTGEAPGSPLCRLVIVPRKPERFDEVGRLIERAGFTCVRRSQHPADGAAAILSPGTVILGDTMGEMRRWYSLASLVFVGRSLVPLGGSDPMEVAALGKAMIVGPHTSNFESAVLAFHEAHAIEIVKSVAELASAARKLLDDPAGAAAMGARARNVVLQNQGATRKTAERLAAIFRRAVSASSARQVSRGEPGGEASASSVELLNRTGAGVAQKSDRESDGLGSVSKASC